MVDDQEEPVWHLSPTDNVYSYFMFVTPTEIHKEGGAFTWDTIMAWILAFLNFFFQGLLLHTVFSEVVVANQEWEASITMKKTWGQNKLSRRKANNDFAEQVHRDIVGAPGQCNPGGSLCVEDKGNISCAPPSVRLTGKWDLLDTDGDGIWTRTEVEEAKDKLQCEFIVNPIEVFDVFINFLKKREKILWLHPDVKAGKAIHKVYFDFAMGDIIMCGYRSTDMCSNLLKRGFFHAPLKHHTAPRVGTTIDSALKYCYDLLEPGGTCEMLLPSTYSVWKVSSNDQCGGPGFSKFVYKNPGSGVVKSLLEVDYDSREKYERSKTLIFKVYKIIIIFLWLLSMCMEIKDIIIVFTWCARFPDDKEFGGEAVLENEDGEYTIQGITRDHRVCMTIMTILRSFLVAVLTYVGVNFLMKQTGYIDLLMDAVTLVFIVEIANIIYTQALRDQIREQTEGINPMVVPKFGIDSLNRRPAIADALWFVGIWIAAVVIVYQYEKSTVTPIFDSLQCACLGVGHNCVEAHKFGYDFWYDYWKNVIPQVFGEVDVLRQSPDDWRPKLLLKQAKFSLKP